MDIQYMRNKLLKKVFPKVKYDEFLETYRIDISDYISLKLNQEQMSVLESMCEEFNIYLEKLPARITRTETEQLFLQLNALKQQISITTDEQALKQLEQDYYNIRNKIFETHQSVIYQVIARDIPEYENLSIKEDIIQIGYECLLHSIDNFDITKGASFKWVLHKYIPLRIIKTLSYLRQPEFIHTELYKLIQAREEETLPTNLDIYEGRTISQTRINELLQLEQILNATSIEEILEQEIDTTDQILDNHPDFVYNIDDKLFDYQIFKDKLMLIIETIPSPKQRDILVKYYGLSGHEAKSVPKIAAEYNTSTSAVTDQLKNALNHLRENHRLKHMRELITNYTEFSYMNKLIVEPSTKHKNSELTKLVQFLLTQLDKEELLQLIYQLEEKYHQILLYYLVPNQEDKDIAEQLIKLGITSPTYYHQRSVAVSKLLQVIKEKYNLEENNIFDYLIYNYLNKSKSHTKKRSL